MCKISFDLSRKVLSLLSEDDASPFFMNMKLGARARAGAGGRYKTHRIRERCDIPRYIPCEDTCCSRLETYNGDDAASHVFNYRSISR